MPDGINYDAFSEALNDKADRDLQNVDTSSGGDAVIAFQRPTAENGYTWFRKYASGWVEQGGKAPTASSDIILTITLPVEMSDTNYTIKTTSTTGNQHANMTAVCTGTGHEISTTGFYIQVTNKNNNAASPTYTYWQVSGMAAQ